MLTVGKTDAFEREYLAKFRAFASKFGEFVTYERDRAARDLGLHLTRKLGSGKEQLSSALCWFQMKGVMATTLTKAAFDKLATLDISLEVAHLKFWYLQPTPTYLVLYIQSVDSFYVLNLQEYVAENWGKEILSLAQKTVTVSVPKNSALDESAFRMILAKSDVEEWTKALDLEKESARLCRRDYDLIWHLGTAAERKLEHRVLYVKWLSKLREEITLQEGDGKDWRNVREHWRLQSGEFDLEKLYPYLECFAFDEDIDDAEAFIDLPNGDIVGGVEAAGEYEEFVFGVRLNDLGRQLFDTVLTLQKLGLIEVTPGKSEFVSSAPWDARDV